MFGKPLPSLAVYALLALLCVHSIILSATGDIMLYIHPRYGLFALVMSLLGLGILTAGIVIELTKLRRPHSTEHTPRPRLLDILVVVIVVLAFALPPQALSSNTTTRKSLNVPPAPVLADSSAQPCPPVTADWPLQSWVYFLGESPAYCFDGKPVTLVGFVMESPDVPLPRGIVYIGRVVVSCCIIDARPYALPVQVDDIWKYPNDTWVRLSGTMRLQKTTGGQQFVVQPDTITKIDKPQDGQYEYLTR